mgnify:CR=1 FL=1
MQKQITSMNSMARDMGMEKEYDVFQPRSSMVPIVVERSNNGERSFDIFSRLLRDRIVFVQGGIGDGMADVVVAQLLFLESDDDKSDVNMYINSPGGSVTSGLGIYDTMNFINCDVSTVVYGQAASMGTILASSGEKGKRFLLEKSSYMIHQPLGGYQGQASDMEIYARNISKTKETLYKIYEENSTKGIKLEKFYELCDRDNFLTPEGVLELGLADEIRTKR